LLANIDWLSAAILVILVADLVLGFRRGLIRQVFDLVGIIVAVLAAIRFGPDAADALVRMAFPRVSAQVASVLGFVIVLLGTLALTELLSYGVGLIARVPGVSVLNNLLGALFRVVRGMILISVALSLLSALQLPAVDSAIARSSLAQSLKPVAGILWNEVKDYIPDHLGIPGIGGVEDGQPQQDGGGML